MRFVFLAIAMLASTAAIAQQPDPEFLKRAIVEVQAQRNQAFDQLAATSVKAATLADDLAKAQARIKELEPKEAKPDKP